MAFCFVFAVLWALWENNALEQATQSGHYIYPVFDGNSSKDISKIHAANLRSTQKEMMVGTGDPLYLKLSKETKITFS